MATELGKAYVQIIPSSEGIGNSISKALGGEATNAGKSAGINIATAIKGTLAVAGIGTAIKASIDAGGAMQQSYGGLDTLYEDAADAAKNYAKEAAKAGISANSYAEQAVSFGASLKQAYGGDTLAAVEAANTAILDMADNSAKMGTPLESIQNAYQGFAKQNYSMLDNLKLGYGGTKGEMERLLADATELSGVEYNLDNLGDVYEAIHVIQENLNLTGVAAAEAEGTFTGSFGSMKASAENLLADLSLGNDISEDMQVLGQSVQSFILNNLLPMLLNIISAIPNLVSGMAQAIITALPNVLSSLAGMGEQIINNLTQGMGNSEGITSKAGELIKGYLDTITANLPIVLSKGTEIISNLVQGVLAGWPQLMEQGSQVVLQFVQFALQNLPALIDSGTQMLSAMIQGLSEHLPDILAKAAEIIVKFVAVLIQNLPKILESGIKLIGQLIAGIIKAIPTLIASIPKVIKAVKDTMDGFDWAQIGKNILEGIKNGIIGAISAVIEAAKQAAQSIWDTVSGFFDIHSPSRKMTWAGEMLDAGWANGIENNASKVIGAVSKVNEGIMSGVSTKPMQVSTVQQPSSIVVNMTINGSKGQSVEQLAELVEERLNNAIVRGNRAYA